MSVRRSSSVLAIAVAVVAALLVVAACSSPTKAPTTPSGEFGVSPGGGFDRPPGPIDAPGGEQDSGYPPSVDRAPTERNPYPGPDEGTAESGAEAEDEGTGESGEEGESGGAAGSGEDESTPSATATETS